MSLVYCKIPSNDIEWPDPAGKPEGKDDEMKNYIVLDGQKIKLDETSSSLLLAILAREKEEKKEKKSPLAREKRQHYWYINECGKLQHDIDKFWFADNVRYDNGNYCTDKELMEQRALHETLNRLLWRFSEESGGSKAPWDGRTRHWYIIKNEAGFIIDYAVFSKTQGTVYFSSDKNAADVLEKVVKPFMKKYPDFVW